MTVFFTKKSWIIFLLIILTTGFFGLFYSQEINMLIFNQKNFPFIKTQPLTKESIRNTKNLQNLVFMNNFLIRLLSYGSEKKTENKRDYLAQINIQLEMEDNFSRSELKDKEMHFKDMITVILSNVTYEQILKKEEKYILETSIKETLNDFLSQGKIKQVYFSKVVLL